LTVTSIGNYAFENCTNLASVTIPANVVGIGDFAFAGASLTSVIIAIANIGEGAFEGCSSLASVTIANGDSFLSIENYAFEDCPILSVVFCTGVAPYAQSDVFYDDANVSVYYLPGRSGWSYTFGGVSAFLWNPLIQTGDSSLGVQSNQFGFNITGTPFIPVVVEVCTNLANQVWTPVQTMTITNGSCYFSEPFQANASGRFYGLGIP
jgi:hypothetical protein